MGKRKNITILGLGNVGSTIASLLLCQKDSLTINIMDPSPDVEGNLLDLQHAVALEKRHKFSVNDYAAFVESDFIFHTAGARIVGNNNRMSVARESIEITREIFDGVQFRNNPYIIVIANPVDIIGYATWKFSGIEASRIIGTGTLLDTIRMEHYLSELTAYDVQDVKAWVVGEHGENMVPLYTHFAVNNQPFWDNKIMQQATLLTNNAAKQIKKNREGTTFGAAECAVHIMNSIMKPHDELLTISVLLNDYHCRELDCEPIFMSVPVKFSAQGIHQVREFGYSTNELAKMKTAAQAIDAVIKENIINDTVKKTA